MAIILGFTVIRTSPYQRAWQASSRHIEIGFILPFEMSLVIIYLSFASLFTLPHSCFPHCPVGSLGRASDCKHEGRRFDPEMDLCFNIGGTSPKVSQHRKLRTFRLTCILLALSQKLVYDNLQHPVLS